MLDDLKAPPGECCFEAREPSRAAFQVDSRSKTERRQTADRREMIRFQEDRRSGEDRRPTTGWHRSVTI